MDWGRFIGAYYTTMLHAWAWLQMKTSTKKKLTQCSNRIKEIPCLKKSSMTLTVWLGHDFLCWLLINWKELVNHAPWCPNFNKSSRSIISITALGKAGSLWLVAPTYPPQSLLFRLLQNIVARGNMSDLSNLYFLFSVICKDFQKTVELINESWWRWRVFGAHKSCLVIFAKTQMTTDQFVSD